jgi:dipeptide/tripeptide permease
MLEIPHLNANTINGLVLILTGSIFYVGASYYHLGLKKWTFWHAFAIAIPLVAIEYMFSLRGNYYAHRGGLSSYQILLITMCFYFMGLIFLNKILGREKPTLRDGVAMAFIIGAFYLAFWEK